MRLTELAPRWVDYGNSLRGVSFRCPVCQKTRLAVPFREGSHTANPLVWGKSGSTFDDLTLTPSIDVSRVSPQYADETAEQYVVRAQPCSQGGQAHWHGHIVGGAVQ